MSEGYTMEIPDILKGFHCNDAFLGYQVGTEELSCWSIIRILLKAYYV